MPAKVSRLTYFFSFKYILLIEKFLGKEKFINMQRIQLLYRPVYLLLVTKVPKHWHYYYKKDSYCHDHDTRCFFYLCR